MITPGVFHRLRAAQLRAVREHELLSGRDWILICACVHVLAMVYPVFLWVHVWLLRSSSLNQHLHPAVNVAFTLLSVAVLLGFWWWAQYAPFRSALNALIAYIVIQGGLAYLDPHQLVIGATFKALIVLGLIQATAVAYRRHRPL
jgi:H+/Cl- antiporter ClcA